MTATSALAPNVREVRLSILAGKVYKPRAHLLHHRHRSGPCSLMIKVLSEVAQSSGPGLSHEFEALSGGPLTDMVKHVRFAQLLVDWGVGNYSFGGFGFVMYRIACSVFLMCSLLVHPFVIKTLT
jgi:hypothetical protein